ncbi:hypothetical protein OAL91_01985 [bacterium]|nr:hypothetical protein [bacterium]
MKLIFGTGAYAQNLAKTIDMSAIGIKIDGFWVDSMFFDGNINLALPVFSGEKVFSESTVYIGVTMELRKGPKFWRYIDNKVREFGGRIGGFCLSDTKRSEVSQAAMVFNDCFMDLNSKIGYATQVRHSCYIGHDVTVGDFCYIAPRANIGSNVVIEGDAFVGFGATILPNVRIGRNVVIAAGAVVARSVASNSLVGRQDKVITARDPFRLI